MARPRAAQFGKDIGVSTNQAKKLINEGRRRKDGGSNVLETTMTEVKKPKVLPKTPKQAVKDKKAKLKMEQMYPGMAEKLGYEPVPLKRQVEAMLKGRRTLLEEEVSPEILERVGESRKKKPTKPNPKELNLGGTVRGMGAAYMGNPRKVQIK